MRKGGRERGKKGGEKEGGIEERKREGKTDRDSGLERKRGSEMGERVNGKEIEI